MRRIFIKVSRSKIFILWFIRFIETVCISKLDFIIDFVRPCHVREPGPWLNCDRDGRWLKKYWWRYRVTKKMLKIILLFCFQLALGDMDQCERKAAGVAMKSCIIYCRKYHELYPSKLTITIYCCWVIAAFICLSQWNIFYLDECGQSGSTLGGQLGNILSMDVCKQVYRRAYSRCLSQ